MGYFCCKVNLGMGLEIWFLFLVLFFFFRVFVVGGWLEDGKEEGGEVWWRGELSYEG